MRKILRISYLIRCFALAMITTFSISYAQDQCPTPGMPSNPYPLDGATNVSVNPTLSWFACSNTDSYNVYFGTSSNPPYLGNTSNVNYPLTNLASNTTYYWRIVAMNSCSNFTIGPVWNFKTVCLPPGIPSNPVPQNGAWVVPTPTPSKSGVIFNVSLGWTSSSYPNSYDVYFGASSNPPFLGNTLTGSYYVSGLTLNTTYFWRVVALSDCGYSTPGPVWSFATSPANPFSSSNWTNIEPPNVSSDWSLYSVHFTSSDEGWAVGTDNQNNRGVLLHYLDGTWTSVNPPDLNPSWWGLSSAHFTSPNDGWAVGTESISPISRGVLLHYLNGSWTNVTPPNLGSSWDLNSVYFISSNEGWAVGTENQKGVLLHYLNGNWEAINAPNYPYSYGFNSVHFTSSDDGWAVGKGMGGGVPANIFIHYSNGSWVSPYAIPYPTMISGLNSVYFISPDEGWAVGGWSGWDVCGSGELFHYSNGSWESSNIGGPCGTLNGVYFTSPNEGWAVGAESSMVLNGSENLFQYWYGDWESVSLPNVSSNWELNSVHFTSSNEGWAVGTDHKNKKGILLGFSAEIISTPTTPNGPTSGKTGMSYTYTTGGSTSSLANPVEYQFDWKGDGSDLSNWSSASQSKTWATAGVYNVRARARSAPDVSVMSGWSNPLSVSISLPKITVTPPAYNFRNVKVKRSKTASFNVKNKGTVNLLVSTSITGTNASMFTITSGSGSKTIKTGKNLTIRVAFKPISKGSKTSSLEITSNDPIAPTIDIPLSGTGQ